uniref:ATP synthase subunit 9, mitochondrial n=1 Tax=Nicotiana tabacum TaxID=4097 RepID=A0A1S3ZGE2_TOBAC|nr:PREDICTED: ATP synthase subunit 9, mitochondrial [Nicotiana tabacum]
MAAAWWNLASCRKPAPPTQARVVLTGVNISAAQAGTGTEVATMEQLTPEMGLPIELDLPAFSIQADFSCTACDAYALHEHLNVQDKKNEGKNRRRTATIASEGAAISIGNVLSSSIHSVAQNLSLAKQLFGYAILGFALTEAIASFAPMMAFLISFVFQVY